jgi:hypothetical protein
VPSFDAGETQRRSTVTLDGMSSVLLWLSHKSSRYVFALAWVAIIVDLLFSLVSHLWPMRFASALLGVAVMFGYPFIIIVGFPAPYSSQASRVTSILALLVLFGACVASAVEPSATPILPEPWIGTVISIPLVALLFSPFFVAAHILGESRRALRVYKPLDSLGAWVSLFYFAQGGSVGCIGFVALHISTDVLGRQQFDLDTQALQLSRPEMGRPTRFHDHQSDGAVMKPALKLGSAQPCAINHFPVLIGDSDLEHALCQIHRNGRSIHVGLLPGCAHSDTTSGQLAHMMPKTKREESIPSLE